MKISNVFCTVTAILSAIAFLLLLLAAFLIPELSAGTEGSLSEVKPDDVTAGFQVLGTLLAGSLSLVAWVGVIALMIILVPYFVLALIPAISGALLLRSYRSAVQETVARKKKRTDSIVKIVISVLMHLYSIALFSTSWGILFVCIILFGCGILLPAILVLTSESLD